MSGLNPGDFVTLSSTVTYGSGTSGTTSLVKSWTDNLGTFTEDFTSFTADRTSTNAITLDFFGTLTGPGGIDQSAMAILTANQASGPPNGAITWSLTNSSPNATTPIPGTLPLLLTGLGAVFLIGRRPKRTTTHELLSA